MDDYTYGKSKADVVLADLLRNSSDLTISKVSTFLHNYNRKLNAIAKFDSPFQAYFAELHYKEALRILESKEDWPEKIKSYTRNTVVSRFREQSNSQGS